jgi:hypothetical protein
MNTLLVTNHTWDNKKASWYSIVAIHLDNSLIVNLKENLRPAQISWDVPGIAA